MFTAGLEQMGIMKAAAMIPTFEYEVEKKLFSKTYNEVPTGFEMQKNIHVGFKDLNLIDELETLAAKNEIYDLVKLDFLVDDTETKYDTLHNAAVTTMNKKAASLQELNIDLSKEYQVVRESYRAIYPESQYADYDAFVSKSVEALKKSTGVTKIRKPKTVASDQMPYTGFDLIIRP